MLRALATTWPQTADRCRKLLLEKLRSAIFDPPLDLLSVLAQRTAPHQNAHGSLARSLPPGRTQKMRPYFFRRPPEPTSDAFARSRPTHPGPQSQTQARKKHFRHWKGPWLITCSPIGTIFDEGVRHDLLDTLPTFQARRQSGGSVRSARTRGKSCREFRAKSNRQSALYTSAALARLQVSTKIQH